MFAIKQITPSDYIKKAIENAVSTEMQIILRRIAYIAEKAVNEQRELGDEYKGLSAEQIAETRKKSHTPNYIDDTGNLRSSIGYMLTMDGETIAADLQNEAARQLAQSALNGSPQGIVLILTAGMEYAKYVHSKGYDVLTTAELFCKKAFKEMLAKYRKK